jgi:hypothetical protein
MRAVWRNRLVVAVPLAAAVAAGALFTVNAAGSTTTDPAASCASPSYDGTTLSLTCTVPQATATVTTSETQTITETATTTQTATETQTATTTVTAPGPTVTVTPSPTPTPTPTPSPTPTTSAPPPPLTFPDATNTGVPAGTVLHACASPITASGTYDGCQFGSLQIRTGGVTITRSLIGGQVTGVNESLFGAVIRDSTIACGCLSTTNSSTPVAIQYNNFTLTRVNLYGSGHGVAMGSNVTVEDSWIHGLGGNTLAHKDGIYVGDGTNSVIRHNNIDCNDGDKKGCTAAIGLLTDFGPVQFFTISDNLLNTIGSYCFYGSGGPQKPYSADHVTFTGNHFGRAHYSGCGFYGPVTYFDTAKPGMVWSGNVWDSDGSPVPPVN